METDFDIEIEDSTEAAKENVQLPLNILLFGEVENDDVKVYIKQDVYKALEKYAREDTDRERGTIIIGDYAEELGKTHVIISNYIEAKYTDASASTLTFTHETWDYIHREHDKRYPDKKIVGWQHTHPSYGIFLSNYDLFIQENFFNMPFQVAYVIDPIQNIRGFFQWKNGKIEKLKGFYIYDDVGKPIKIEQSRPEKKKSEAGSRPPRLIYALTALLCVATVILSVSLISVNKKYEEQQKAQDTIIEELGRQEAMISDQANTISELQEQIKAGLLDENGKTTAEELIERIESGRLTVNNREDVLSQLRSFVSEAGKDGNDVKFKSYTVDPGDTLIGICRANGIDYYDNAGIILGVNGIENTRQLQVGQVLLLPVAGK